MGIILKNTSEMVQRMILEFQKYYMNGNWRTQDIEDDHATNVSNLHQTKKNLEISTEDVQNRDQWRAIFSGKTNIMFLVGDKPL